MGAVKQLKEQLQSFKRKTITMDELATFVPSSISYKKFAEQVLELERDKLLTMVKAKGRNTRQPSLAYHYRLDKHQLLKEHYKELQTFRLQFHEAIDLDAYFSLSPQTWLEDLVYVEKINAYINTYGFPKEYAPAPERSFHLVGDEKWIDEKQGKKVLQRIKLWEAFHIIPVADPLMFAIHPAHITATSHYHLIVENKTTYHALLAVLPKSSLSTLIYGAGKQIESTIDNFSWQYPLHNAKHHFLYFGDMDYEGIAIWHRLNKKLIVQLALPFYLACLEKDAVYGKENHVQNKIALHTFSHMFSEEVQNKIMNILENKAYIPQEILQTQELQAILLETDWAKEVLVADGMD